MGSLNMLNYPVEQIFSKSAVTLKSVRTNYLNFGTTPAHIYPQTVDAKQGTNAYETRLRYTSYDNNTGDLLTVSKEGDVLNSYIWDYLSTYPVAQAVNAAQADIAYTSFEADGKGNWTYSGSTVTDATAPTGKKVYNMAGGNLGKSSGLSATNVYIISYWRPTGLSALTITGTQSGYPISGATTAGGWKYFEHKVTGITAITLAGTGLIDEVRLYPSAAQMSTNTYDPLIGMTIQCDMNNRITYYEYDEVPRLVIIRNQDRNILKKLCYNYAG